MPNVTMRPVESITHLDTLCRSRESRYRELAVSAATNIGGNPKDWREAMDYFRMYWYSMVGEYDQDESEAHDGIVDEINFCLDLVPISD